MDQLIGLLNDMGKTSRTRSLSDGGAQDDDEGEWELVVRLVQLK